MINGQKNKSLSNKSDSAIGSPIKSRKSIEMNKEVRNGVNINNRRQIQNQNQSDFKNCLIINGKGGKNEEFLEFNKLKDESNQFEIKSRYQVYENAFQVNQEKSKNNEDIEY